MRLFVALRPSPAAIEEIGSIQWGLRGVRWTDPDQIHLTLRFVGDLLDPAPLIERLDRLVWEPFEVQLKGVGRSPTRGDAKIAWVGVQPCEQLSRLQQRIERCVREAGVVSPRRRFRPHVTIARFETATVEDFGQFMVGRSLFRCTPWPADEVYLFRSRLRRSGAEYELLGRFSGRA